MKEYFDQDALLFPLDTIIGKQFNLNTNHIILIEKSEAKDFQFFLKQANFLKVVDTLEKFQAAMVNTQSGAGKDFILFKRQLYQMYEVQNRSIYEHEHLSMGIERRNLKWLYNANLDYVNEI